MPPSPEKTSHTKEVKISAAERKAMMDELIAEAKTVFDPQLVYDPRGREVSKYAPLITMMRRLSNDTALSPHQLGHLRKITAWKAFSMNRTAPIPGIKNRPEFWRVVDEEVGEELAIIERFPQDLTGVTQPWKNALYDHLKIELEWLEPKEE
ncbi:hypothetical protein HY379_02430 [Candidatus Saccharibacteria bacterium]|nr:hypothetical protein [Candidatus Saccharibacteria bacterium]